MAAVLSLRPQSPLKRSFSDNPYFNPCSSVKDTRLASFSDIAIRNPSACSLTSLATANRPIDWFQNHENTSPLTSQSLLELVPEQSAKVVNENCDIDQPRKRACGVDRPPPSFRRAGLPSEPYTRKTNPERSTAKPCPRQEVSNETTHTQATNFAESDLFNFYEAIRVPLPEGRFRDREEEVHQSPKRLEPVSKVSDPQPFKRWMSSLRNRRTGREKAENGRTDDSTSRTLNTDLLAPLVRQFPILIRRNSESSSSSFGCVTAIKSASITVAGTSIAPPSDAGIHGRQCPGNRSSDGSEARRSLEGHPLGPVMDESAWLRSLQRRRIVEELIASEESYIADLKVLINVR